jgi:hypothetical protein
MLRQINLYGGFTMRLTSILALLTSSVLLSTTLSAKEEDIGDDGYNKTYNDSSKPFKDRMKEARTTPVVSSSSGEGAFTLGIQGDFGPVYDAEPSSTSGMGYGVALVPGFMIQRDTWSRIEIGADIGFHSLSWKPTTGASATLSPLSLVPYVGFGHSLGDQLFGTMKFGFGIANGKVDVKSGSVSSSSESKAGFVASASYDASVGSSGSQFFGGVGATHYKFAYSEFGSGSSKTDLTVNLNHVNLHAGFRAKF